ncbi:MAG: hypothetical protein CFE44_29335, partial [Burkholderiales bacterium PBB4]
MAFWFGAVPMFVVPYLFWISQASEKEADVVKIHLASKIYSPDARSRWEIRDQSGQYKVVEAVTSSGQHVRALTPTQIKKALQVESPALAKFYWYCTLSFILPFFGYALVWFFLRRLGQHNMEDKRVRGAEEIVTPEKLNAMEKSKEKGT